MGNKSVFKSKEEVDKWLKIGNLFAKSLCADKVVLRQFNNLTAEERSEIKKKMMFCEEVRKKKLLTKEGDEWVIGIMVDANIIAGEYNIDPLTVLLCMNPICKGTERIIIKNN